MISLALTILKLLPQEQGENIALLSENEFLVELVSEFCSEFNANITLLDSTSVQKPLGNERFESMIFDDSDDIFENVKTIKSIKNALQKNRTMIIISKTLNSFDLEAKLDEYGFSNFSTIEHDGYNINVVKKWFTNAQ
ncbi:MAG: hypothetical protein GQ570_10055 [Helicobacteraceae bacterium]|nr:hypothetical protein [Helicobacteraceae bacterium]